MLKVKAWSKDTEMVCAPSSPISCPPLPLYFIFPSTKLKLKFHFQLGPIFVDWKTSNKEPVKNKELWQELYELTKVHEVEFIKVKGHSDNELNNRCDELARQAIK